MPQKPKAHIGMKFNPELLEKARDAVYWTYGLSLVRLFENAVEREIKRMERNRKEGPFPPRERELRTDKKAS